MFIAGVLVPGGRKESGPETVIGNETMDTLAVTTLAFNFEVYIPNIGNEALDTVGDVPSFNLDVVEIIQVSTDLGSDVMDTVGDVPSFNLDIVEIIQVPLDAGSDVINTVGDVPSFNLDIVEIIQESADVGSDIIDTLTESTLSLTITNTG